MLINETGILDLSRLASVKPHKPSIKFNRKSSFKPTPSLHTQLNVAFDQSLVAKESDEISEPSSQASQPLEWWQRPAKYSREVLDDKEIEQINSGGADKTFY